jgi:flavin reductase (DIM6/NTAB) family NADH-FMN oxidoreductase RutF
MDNAPAFCIFAVALSTRPTEASSADKWIFRMDYDPRSEPHNLAHDPTTSLVVPRPIGWITTISPTGVVNLAPYSFFNLIASHPPFVMFASNSRKHTQKHAQSGGEFVFNLATYDLRREMNVTGGDYPENVSEPDVAKLAMAPSRFVKPPRVAKSPIALECVYAQTVSLKSSNGKTHSYEMVIGEVVNVHIDDAVIVDRMIDMARLRPIARLGYRGDYTVVDTIFEMKRV